MDVQRLGCRSKGPRRQTRTHGQLQEIVAQRLFDPAALALGHLGHVGRAVAAVGFVVVRAVFFLVVVLILIGAVGIVAERIGSSLRVELGKLAIVVVLVVLVVLVGHLLRLDALDRAS